MNAADSITSKIIWVPPEIDAAISKKDIFDDSPSKALLKITLIGAIVTSGLSVKFAVLMLGQYTVR
ncbi:hypothetical protein, partial [Pseudomonas lopnurensis]|uniref:hypothetical protein n=1 Tax=Pseudomonas lopnurensis TaxID=1477517 RepID=UPI0028A75FD5